jgi:hypothetical protein
MDYGRVIQDAWNLTWRYRFLWVLGFFAGGAVGVPSGGNGPVQWRMQGSDLGLPASPGDALPPGWPLIIALIVGVIALVLALWLIAQGGMARATADLARGQPSSLGQAWRAGTRLAWRYLGLWLLLCVGIVLIAAIIGALVALALAPALISMPVPRWTTLLLGVAIGLPLVLALIVALIVVSIVIAYAQRIIAMEDVGATAALRHGWGVLQAHPRESLLLWLMNVGLAIGAGLVLGIVTLVVGGLIAGAVALVWLASGQGPALIGAIALAAVVLIALLVVLVAIANTFFWSYWTIGYVRLSEMDRRVASNAPEGGIGPLRPGATPAGGGAPSTSRE